MACTRPGFDFSKFRLCMSAECRKRLCGITCRLGVSAPRVLRRTLLLGMPHRGAQNADGVEQLPRVGEDAAARQQAQRDGARRRVGLDQRVNQRRGDDHDEAEDDALDDARAPPLHRQQQKHVGGRQQHARPQGEAEQNVARNGAGTSTRKVSASFSARFCASVFSPAEHFRQVCCRNRRLRDDPQQARRRGGIVQSNRARQVHAARDTQADREGL